MRFLFTIGLSLCLAGCVSRAAEQPDVQLDVRGKESPPQTHPSLSEQDRKALESANDKQDFSAWASSFGPTDQRCLELIHQSPAPAGVRNPVTLIRAVNALLPLGRKHAMELLRAFCRFFEQREEYEFEPDANKAMHVARLLFVNKDGTGLTRAPGIGSFMVVTRDESKEWPLFPLQVSGDVPFEVSVGLMLMGFPESASSYLAYIDECCDLRPLPLRPADNPCLAADDLLGSAAWKDIRFSGDEPGHHWTLSESWLATVVRRQALCAVADIFEPQEDIQAALSNHSQNAWADLLKRVEELKPRWDVEKQKYVSDR